MKLFWTPEALDDRRTIYDYIELDNPVAANKLDQLFEGVEEKLVNFPKLGRPGEIPGTREFVIHESYRLVYEIGENVVIVTAVVHTAKRWPL